jgi:hypothetical protein
MAKARTCQPTASSGRSGAASCEPIWLQRAAALA